MGYYTSFSGEWTVDPPFTPEHQDYLDEFAKTRHVKLRPELIRDLPDPVRSAVGYPVGIDGMFYTGADLGSSHPAVVDYNATPSGVPELWCYWLPTSASTFGAVDEETKAYGYIEWLHFLMAWFIKPWGYTLNGVVHWNGESREDMGRIVIDNNEIRVLTAVINWV